MAVITEVIVGNRLRPASSPEPRGTRRAWRSSPRSNARTSRAKEFGLPEKARSKAAKKETGNYPMPDKGHAISALRHARAAARGRQPHEGRVRAHQPQGAEEAEEEEAVEGGQGHVGPQDTDDVDRLAHLTIGVTARDDVDPGVATPGGEAGDRRTSRSTAVRSGHRSRRRDGREARSAEHPVQRLRGPAPGERHSEHTVGSGKAAPPSIVGVANEVGARSPEREQADRSRLIVRA